MSTRGWMLVAVAAGLGGFLLCYLLLVRTGIGQRFDNAAYLGSKESAPRYRTGVSNVLNLINVVTFALALLVIVVIGWARRRLRLGLAVAFAAGVAVELADAIRKTGAARPSLVASDSTLPGNTFPSGHTTTAVACALALTAVCAPRWRGAVAVATGAYASATAAQVQTALWHRPSDALGGSFLAFALVCAAVAWAAPRREPEGPRSRSHGLAFAVLGATAGLAIALTVWWLSRVWNWMTQPSRNPVVTHFVRHEAYLGGLAATVLLVVVLVTAFLALMGTDRA